MLYILCNYIFIRYECGRVNDEYVLTHGYISTSHQHSIGAGWDEANLGGGCV